MQERDVFTQDKAVCPCVCRAWPLVCCSSGTITAAVCICPSALTTTLPLPGHEIRGPDPLCCLSQNKKVGRAVLSQGLSTCRRIDLLRWSTSLPSLVNSFSSRNRPSEMGHRQLPAGDPGNQRHAIPLFVLMESRWGYQHHHCPSLRHRLCSGHRSTGLFSLLQQSFPPQWEEPPHPVRRFSLLRCRRPGHLRGNFLESHGIFPRQQHITLMTEKKGPQADACGPFHLLFRKSNHAAGISPRTFP